LTHFSFNIWSQFPSSIKSQNTVPFMSELKHIAPLCPLLFLSTCLVHLWCLQLYFLVLIFMSMHSIVSLCFNVFNRADPNRPGMHMKLIKFLLKLKAPRIVYVSCNPATCARDLDYLCHGAVCLSFLPPRLSLSLSLSSHMMFWNSFAERAKYKRLLHAKETTTCRHVPAHSSYWMHLPAGALLIPSYNHGFQ
jgi:hypothetical protein